MTLFNLQTHIRVCISLIFFYNSELTIPYQEPQFAKEFLQRDGLAGLISIIENNSGNTLAVSFDGDVLDAIEIVSRFL